MKKTLLFILGVLLSLPAMARDFTYEYEGHTLTYTVIDEETKTCQVKPGYMENSTKYASHPDVSGDLVIPEVAAGYKVIAIGEYAFDHSLLHSISIPGSVTSIGKDAFWIPALRKAEFASIEALCKIYFESAYSNPLYCARHLYISGKEVTEVVIPEGVTSVGNFTFIYCSYLTSVTIPGSVTSIGKNAFRGCKLTKVEFTSIESICKINFEFSYVQSLDAYYCESNPLSFAQHLYINGKEVTELVIPEGVTSIGKAAFLGCIGLTSVTIPSSVTSIGSIAFDNCNGLEKAEFASIDALCKIDFETAGSNPLLNAHNLYINGREVTEIVFPEGLTTIGNSTFAGGSGLTSVTIPEVVTTIGHYAFNGCSGLSSLTIPSGVTSIGDGAFFNCSGLSSVTIPDGVKSISADAFGRCSGLTSVTIPDGVKSIGSGAFYECSGLNSMTIPDGVKSIGDYAFYKCSGLTSVIIPGSVKSIGGYAFEDCSGLTSVTISEGVTSIGDGAFYECSGLNSVTIPDGVTSIGGFAFFKCSGLSSVTIPESVTSIGDYAFYECSNLNSIYYGTDKPISGEANIFSDKTYYKATLYMTEKGIAEGRLIDPWKNFTKIETYAFSDIEEVVADFDENAPYEVFNLNGVKVGSGLDGLTPGLYIRRQGGAANKVVVK